MFLRPKPSWHRVEQIGGNPYLGRPALLDLEVLRVSACGMTSGMKMAIARGGGRTQRQVDEEPVGSPANHMDQSLVEGEGLPL